MRTTRLTRFVVVGAVASVLPWLPAAATAPAAHAAQDRAAAVPTPTTRIVNDQPLEVPWDVAFLPDGRMVVTERPGRIEVFGDGVPGAENEQTFVVPDVRRADDAGVVGEAGVMGVAVDTDFARHPYVYVCASRDVEHRADEASWFNQVLRYRVSLTTQTWSAPTVILSGMHAARTHNGCALEMDRSGLLWVGMGDGGVKSRAQDRASLNGKVLRITRTGGVPTTNPVIDGRRDAVYSMGHRNPQGIAFQPGTDRVYDVEHGPGVDDEINLLVPGGNYGWPCYTGADHPDTPDGCGPASDYRAPVWASGDPTIAPSGGSFTRGAQWGDWAGNLFVSVLKDQELLRFAPGSDGSLTGPEILDKNVYGRLRASVPGPGGRLYLTTSNGSDDVLQVSVADTSTHRIGGADRYEVAATVSAETYPDGVDEVIVAAGSVFSDALTGSAAGGHLGRPVLLTRTGSLPDTTRAEIERLAPSRITVLGGPASVSDAVYDELSGLAPDIDRIGGATRYAVAAGVADAWYPAGGSPVFVASGEVFSDALSAAPAAAKNGAPVLLVRRDGIPAATREALRRLDPTRVHVLGGVNTISRDTLRSLRHYTEAPISRIDGADRYAVSRHVAQQFWRTADAYVASGEVFPDGLTGGAAAGHDGVPLLLTRSDRVAADAGQALLDLAPTRLTIVGGPASVSPPEEYRLGTVVGYA